MKSHRAFRWRARLAVFVPLLVLLTVIAGRALAQSPPPDTSATTGLVTMEVGADPTQVPLDQIFTVEITLQGDGDQCGQTEVIKPLDVFLVIDHSGSMDDENKLEQARQASVVFLNEMNPSFDRVGVAVFDDGATVIQEISDNFPQVKQAIETISAGGGTNVAAGLIAAYESLKPERRPDAVPVIIVLSDGQSDVQAIAHAADVAKADGFVVVAVGLGSDVDQNAMQVMASQDTDGNPLYYFAPEPDKLDDIYLSIARAIRKYGVAANINLQAQVDVYNYQIIPDSLQPAGAISGDTITWQQDMLDSGSTVFSFQVRGRTPGEAPVAKSIVAQFSECEQEDKTLRLDNIPLVTITQVVEPPPVPQQCAPWQLYPWWLLAPLLLLLLFVAFARSAPGRRLWRKCGAKSLPCQVLVGLLMAAFLVFSALLARTLMGNLCFTPEVYFWKIEAGGQVGVYRASLDARQAKPVNILNRNSNCVACHQVASNQVVAAIRDKQNGQVAAAYHNGRSIPLPELHASYIAWSPDGEKLAVSYNDVDIYIFDVKSGELQPLAGASEPDAVETMPAWSPDGKTIAFVRAPRTAPPPNTAALEDPCGIYTVPAEGGMALPLPGASGNGFNYYPAYSPDGKWLAFTRHLDGQDTYADDAADIYIIPANGTQTPVRLSINSEYSDSWPSWSPDSKWLGFSSNRRDGQFDVFVVPIGENGLPYELTYDDAGRSSNVFQVPAAFLEQDEEFHPVWVENTAESLTQRLLGLWPWLIPLLLLSGLVWLFCREPLYTVEVKVIDGLTGRPIDQAKVRFFRQERDE